MSKCSGVHKSGNKHLAGESGMLELLDINIKIKLLPKNNAKNSICNTFIKWLYFDDAKIEFGKDKWKIINQGLFGTVK
jgi:hypothetical protein